MADGDTERGWRRVWHAAQAVPLLPVAGLYLIVRGQWLWFEHLDTVRPGGIPVLLGIGLLLISAGVTCIGLSCPARKQSGEVNAAVTAPLRDGR